ncbi:MAG: hypothetical protein ACRYFK_21035 [Janthinobacterium lividum]
MRLVLIALLVGGSLAAHAQTTPAPATAPVTAAAKPAKMAAAYHAGPPEQRAERLSQQVAKQLGLDAATTAKVKDAALTRAQKIDAIQTGTDSNKAKNTALQANAQAFKEALKSILTPAQFAQYSTHGKAAAE